MAIIMLQNKSGDGGKAATGVRRVWNAFFYSMDGLKNAIRNESAFRQECVLALILVPISLWMPVGWAFRALLAASVLGVLTTELLNSAIEAVVDYISLEKHPLAKKAKDMGSAAVFISLLSCGLVWVCALWECLGRSRFEKWMQGLH